MKILVYHTDVGRNWPGTVNSVTNRGTAVRIGIEVLILEMYSIE
jgi:hypothetical protein